MKNNPYKTALLAAIGLASVTIANAQSDILLGFNDAGANDGPATYQNDYVIDLGAISHFTMTSTYSTTIDQATFNNTFGSDANYLNDVAVGVVAEDNTASPKQIYVSSASQPSAIPTTRFNDITVSVGSIVAGEYSMASGISVKDGWTYNVGVAPGDPGTLNGNTAGNGNEVAADGVSPLEYLSNGILTVGLYEATSLGTSHPFSEIGTFTINVNTGVNDGLETISYEGIDRSAAYMPESDKFGASAGAALLLFSLRRQFSAKKANAG